MRRIKLIIEYDGTNYCGWQSQNNGVSIQQKIEEAIRDITGEELRVTGSGRTDSGVHALGQVAHFDTSSMIPAERIAFALNTKLPEDIRIRSSQEVDETFHARKSSKIKHYRYTIYNDTHENAMLCRYSAFVRQKLDVTAMQKAAEIFEGEHDFAAFCAAGSTPVATTLRRIYSCKVSAFNKYITIDVEGNGFLYNMVRIMAGTLIDAGKGRLKSEDITEIILSKDRTKASATAPAKGLTMVEAIYGETV